MLKAVAEARKLFDFKGQIMEKDLYLEAVECLRDAVMAAYPAYIDLPEWEPSLLMF